MRWSDDNDDERSSNGLEVVFFRRFWRLQVLTTRARPTGSRSSRAPSSVVSGGYESWGRRCSVLARSMSVLRPLVESSRVVRSWCREQSVNSP